LAELRCVAAWWWECRVDSKLAHLESSSEEVVVALALCLGRLPSVTPDVHAMTAHQYCG